MAEFISIEWLYGRPRTAPEDDEARARDAAAKILKAAGVSPVKAYQAYQAQWAKYDDEAPMTGPARVWIDARDAAADALTEGWHNPNGASCTISAWKSSSKPA